MKTFRRKSFIGLLAMVLTLTVSAQEFTIKGQIHGLADGLVLELTYGATHERENTLATAVVSSGKFELKYSTDIPKQFGIRPEGGYNIFSVVVQAGDDLKVDGTVTPRGDSYSIRELNFSGSEMQDAYQQKMDVRNELDKVYAVNEAKHASVRAKLNEARRANDEELQKEIRLSDEWRALQIDDKAFFALVEERYGKVISENKETFWGPLLVLNFYTFFPPGYARLYDQFSDEIKNTYYGQILKSKVIPVELKGQIAPVIAAKNRNGEALDLAKISENKKYILVDFWASWCVPCRRKIPELKAFYEKHKDNGLEILAISIDNNEADWVKASDEEKFLYADYYDAGETAKNWNVRAIPAWFVLDASGKVVGEEMSLAELEKLLLN